MSLERLTVEYTASMKPMKAGIPRKAEIAIALIALIILSPLLALTLLLIVFSSRGPVLFRQRRVGQGGRGFVLYKLRTMRVGLDGLHVTSSDDARITTVGKFLRRTKLDEIPELWNVVKGDMSLVGPRPEVPQYVDQNNLMWQAVLTVRPGLTDPMTLLLYKEEALLAMVEGDRERFYLETLQPIKLKGYIDYLQTRSCAADLRVLFKTCQAILLPRYVAQPTTQEFEPSDG